MAFASAGGVSLCYETFGDPSRPPLLMVMGLASQMILWPEDFCQALAARGHWVIRFDNRDVGRSTWLDDAGRPALVRAGLKQLLGRPVEAPYDLADMASDGFAVLDHLGVRRAHVCGASMGGMIAQAMACAHPERLVSLVSMMSSTGDPRYRPTWKASLASLLQRPRDREEYLEQQVMLWRTIGSPGFPFDADAVRARAARAWDRGQNRAGTARQLAAIMASGDRTGALSRLRIPALVIHGDGDPMVPLEGGRATAAAIPGAELMVLEGMGHDLPAALRPRLADAIAAHTARADEIGDRQSRRR